MRPRVEAHSLGEAVVPVLEGRILPKSRPVTGAVVELLDHAAAYVALLSDQWNEQIWERGCVRQASASEMDTARSAGRSELNPGGTSRAPMSRPLP
ncbi:hypothetical protein Aple_064880 [Acrocarpospora pleiomorpha]|uniref:Uncharacterized protein n=1 Tax=Acrocarpospora pleiomorpha TaxID=90975 RepID=A0A5M3XUA8_9ACTN|nr:hypothetical protein [Acrocarpospora pleiomorpha]GES23589.1 hypothetical protein Aple_064880 [Acrocarpospora pleiomorpha]